MADLLTDDELELTEEERRRKAQPDAIGSPIAPDVIRKAGGLSYGPQPPIATAPSKLPDSLTPPQPESIGAPLQLAPSMTPRPAYEKYQQVQNSPAGVEKLHGFGGGLVKGLEAVGTAINPGMMAGIPGTRMHHQMDVGHARTAAEEENKEILSQGEEQLHNAQSQEQLALAKKNATPPDKVGQTPEEVTIHDLMTGNNGQPRPNPKTQQPYTYMDAYTDVMTAKNATKPERNISTKEDLQHRIAVAHEKGDRAEETRLQNEMWATDPESRARFDESNRQKSSARSDKSFQYNNGALDKVATPIDQSVQRLGRLNDAIAQNTPQADALIAPELLSVMAGGPGSGLRMNEAEISRIVGGRSKWESLKSAVNQWSLDPSKANSITPEQRQEIRSLVKTVQDKLNAKQGIIDHAREALIDSDDPKEHRRILADTKKQLDAIDAVVGAQGTSTGDRIFTDADVQSAVQANPGSTPQQIEQAFLAKGWKKK